MGEMYSPKSIELVGKENDRQYGEVWPWSADIRRHLTLEYSVPKIDQWSDMAEAVVKSGARRVIEYGCSSGYIIRQMLKHGFDGEVVGIDKEDSNLPIVEEVIRNEFPDSKASVRLVAADAQHVTLSELGEKPFDAGIAANIIYHVPKPKLLFKSINEAVEDGGLQIFSTKDIDHQEEIWTIANLIATHYNAKPLHSFYWHFPIKQMNQSLKQSDRFTVIPDLGGEQDSETQIPNNDYGWSDLRDAVLTLVHLMEVTDTGLPPEIGGPLEFIESDWIKKFLFEQHATMNGGYFKGKVHMAWAACRNNNSSRRPG